MKLKKAMFFASLAFFAGTINAQVKNASLAAAEDVKAASDFLANLPSNCTQSRAYATSDRRVTIDMICDGVAKGVIVLKGGKIIDIK